MITNVTIATIAVVLVLFGVGAPVAAGGDTPCNSEASLDGESAEAAVECPQVKGGGSGVSSETKRQRWVRLCGGSGISGYAAGDDELEVDVIPVGEASAVVSEKLFTEYGREAGSLEIIELGDFTVPTTGTYIVNQITCTAGNASAVIRRVFAQGTELSPIEMRDRVVATLRIPEPSLAGAPSLIDSSNARRFEV